MSLNTFKAQLLSQRSKGFFDHLFPKWSELHFGRKSAMIVDAFFFKALEKLCVENLIECGANDAHASKTASELGIRAVAIEANPVTFDRLTSRVPSSVAALNIGLGRQEGVMTFYVPKGVAYAGDATFNPRSGVEYDEIEIPVDALDDVLQRESLLDDTAITALWVDVEGYQEDFLIGADETLKNPRCVLIKIEVENVALFVGQILSEKIDTRLRSYGFDPILCDSEYGIQFNVVYMKKDYIDDVAQELLSSWGKIKRTRYRLHDLGKDIGIRTLVLAKRFVTSLFGERIGNVIGAVLGSKRSKQYFEDKQSASRK